MADKKQTLRVFLDDTPVKLTPAIEKKIINVLAEHNLCEGTASSFTEFENAIRAAVESSVPGVELHIWQVYGHAPPCVRRKDDGSNGVEVAISTSHEEATTVLLREAYLHPLEFYVCLTTKYKPTESESEIFRMAANALASAALSCNNLINSAYSKDRSRRLVITYRGLPKSFDGGNEIYFTDSMHSVSCIPDPLVDPK